MVVGEGTVVGVSCSDEYSPKLDCELWKLAGPYSTPNAKGHSGKNEKKLFVGSEVPFDKTQPKAWRMCAYLGSANQKTDYLPPSSPHIHFQSFRHLHVHRGSSIEHFCLVGA